MKKILLSCLALAMSASMFAITYTSQVTIALFDGSQVLNLTVGESSDAEFAGGALVNGFYAPVQDLKSSPIAVYAFYNDAEYENLVLDDMTNVPMGIKTSSATSYTLYFANLEGNFKIYDKVAKQEIDCSAAYPFTIDADDVNSIINDRFVLQYVPAAPSFCFRNNILEINGHEGESLVITEKASGADIVTETLDAEYQYSFDGKSGRFIVTLNGQAYHIDASVVPDPVVP